MAFVKTGDEVKIESIFNDNGKEQFCTKCGKKLQLISINGEENDLVCECEVKKLEDLN